MGESEEVLVHVTTLVELPCQSVGVLMVMADTEVSRAARTGLESPSQGKHRPERRETYNADVNMVVED